MGFHNPTMVLNTLGRYDMVVFYEAPSEKEAMMAGMMFSDHASFWELGTPRFST
jgi:uncharacterized protein with GYD domain